MRNRHAWFSALLSLIAPGLGQLRNRAPIRAVGWAGAVLGLGMILRWGSPRGFGQFTVLITCVTLSYLLCAVDAYVQAQALPLRSNPLRVAPLVLGAGWIAATLALHTLVDGVLPLRIYVIGTEGAMQPLATGDWIHADSSAYAGRALVRGELVVLRHPDDPTQVAVRQVVGIPGDRIEFFDRRLLINGADHAPVVLAARPGPYKQTVAADQLFVLGDLDDPLNDSRAWGTVSRANVLARPVFVFLSLDPKKRKIRWSRIGIELYHFQRTFD